MADNGAHAAVAVHLAQLFAYHGTRVPGTAGEFILAILFSCDLGHHCSRCGILDGNEDPADMAKGSSIRRFFGLLSDRRGAGRRKGQTGACNPDSRALACFMEQVNNTVPRRREQTTAATFY